MMRAAGALGNNPSRLQGKKNYNNNFAHLKREFLQYVMQIMAAAAAASSIISAKQSVLHFPRSRI
jgi:hypothetical protein